jgi:hypothetical protein
VLAGCTSTHDTNAPAGEPANRTNAATAPVQTGTTAPTQHRWGAGAALGFDKINAISCASPSFCVAGNQGGQVSIYNGQTWSSLSTVDPYPPGGALASASCPTAQFCVLIDSNGYAVTWRDGTWQASTQVVAGAGLDAVSCASPTFCVAVDDNGDAATFDGAGWVTTDVVHDSNDHLTSISCPAAQTCVAMRGLTGRSRALHGTSWSSDNRLNTGDDAYVTGLSCAAADSCTAVDNNGRAYTWNGQTWSQPRIVSTGRGLTSVSCPSTATCIAGTGRGDGADGVVTFGPTGGGTLTTLDHGTILSVSCATADACTAGSDSGKVYTR